MSQHKASLTGSEAFDHSDPNCLHADGARALAVETHSQVALSTSSLPRAASHSRLTQSSLPSLTYTKATSFAHSHFTSLTRSLDDDVVSTPGEVGGDSRFQTQSSSTVLLDSLLLI